MKEVVEISVKYDTADHNGETRRKRYERFGEPCPEAIIQEEFGYLLEWFWDLNLDRIENNPITRSDMQVWIEQTGNILWPEEINILKHMDQTYITAMSRELDDIRRRQAAELK